MLRSPLHWLARVSKRVFTKEAAALWSLLILATLMRLPLMPFQGYYHDLGSYVTWGNSLVTHGFSNLYLLRAHDMSAPGAAPRGGVVFDTVNYPPGMPYLFACLQLLYNFTLAPVTHTSLTSLVGHYGVGPFFAKLLALIADLAITTLIYYEARKRHSQRFAFLAAASIAFSPPVLYDGVIWGQTDALVMLPVLVAVFALFSRRHILGGVCIAVAFLLKAQSVVFVPLMLIYLWRWARREDFISFSAALVGTALLLLAPVIVPRFQLYDMLYNMREMSYNGNFTITRDAFNIWWLTGLYRRTLSSALLGINIGLVADALFGAVTLIIAVQVWRHREPAYLCFGLALEGFGFFMFMGGQLERYLFPFVPLMLVTLIMSERKSSDRLLILYVSGTILSLLNMMITVGGYLVGISPMIPYLTFQPLYDFVVNQFLTLSLATAVYIAVTFGLAMRIFLTGRFEPLKGEEQVTVSQTEVEVSIA